MDLGDHLEDYLVDLGDLLEAYWDPGDRLEAYLDLGDHLEGARLE